MSNQESHDYSNEHYLLPEDDTDSELRRAVNDALSNLEPELRDIINKRYWEQLTPTQIASYIGIPAADVRAKIRQAHTILRPLLMEYAATRWHFRPRGYCLICQHDKRAIIDDMLLQNPPFETWGEFGRKLENAIGEKINPPRLLIVHLKHIQNGGAAK